MLAALRRIFAALTAPSPREVRLRDEAAVKALALTPSTLVVLAKAAYLPHGGRDWLLLELTPGAPGRVERERSRERREPERIERTLDGDEAARVLAELEQRAIWKLRDAHESVLDGLVAEIAFARGGEAHSVTLRAGRAESDVSRLLTFLFELAPIAC